MRKEKEIIIDYLNGDKPSTLRKVHKVSAPDIYKCIKKFRSKLIQKLEHDVNESDITTPSGRSKVGRKSKIDDPELHEVISSYVKKYGIYNTKLSHLRSHIAKALPAKPPPCESTLSIILKKTFHLKYKKLNPANYRYRDPTYNEKRLWVSRLMAHFILDGWLIVSIDESSLKSDNNSNRQWEFCPKIKDEK
jgi:hypothetical protein